MRDFSRHRGFTMLEAVVYLAVVVALLAVLVPTLFAARQTSHRQRCAENLRLLGEGWAMYLEEREQFPTIYVQPGWNYGGVRFSVINDKPYVDQSRPLNPFLPVPAGDARAVSLFHCPGDAGVTDEAAEVGTGRRTAYRSWGTSYRANAVLFQAPLGLDGARRGLRLDEITASPSWLAVMGDPVWYEVLENTGRLADWHAEPDTGNLLFLDGSVRFTRVVPRPVAETPVFDPLGSGSSTTLKSVGGHALPPADEPSPGDNHDP